MDNYDVVFVGFPIWWYREPSIIDTFMESYVFAGKTVVPFATSGSSGIGSSGANMNKLAPQARVATGQRFDANVSADTIAAWAQTWL
jgi:putative NADPH-quinone reductase